MTKHEKIKKEWIKITADQMRRILTWSGLQFRTVRNGNRFYSCRKTVLKVNGTTKFYWPTVMYSYSSVNLYQGNMDRELEVSEIFLNPEYKYLLNK